MEPNEIPQILEAILFVAGEPVAVADLAQALEVSEMEIMHAVEALERECERRGVTVHRYGDHLRMETRPEYAPYVERLLQPVQRQTLSQTAMETLAVIAYRQPVTKGEVGDDGQRFHGGLRKGLPLHGLKQPLHIGRIFRARLHAQMRCV